MTTRPIIDAGPALNFFAINRERLLFSVIGRISTPETVEREVLSKSRSEARFRAAEAVWRKLKPGNWIEVLSDDVTDGLAAAVGRISGMPMHQRIRKARDLGELMVLGHAVVKAESGLSVIVLIDDNAGATLATYEIARLERLRIQGRPVGKITLVNTPTILRRAAGGAHIPDRSTMRTIYNRLRSCDDGLLPVERTNLLSREVWGENRE